MASLLQNDRDFRKRFPSLSIIGPVMQLFHAYLGAPTTGRVGAQHTLNAEYFKRIDALNYTMMHALARPG